MVTYPARLAAASVGTRSKVSSAGPKPGWYPGQEASSPSSHRAIRLPRLARLPAAFHWLRSDFNRRRSERLIQGRRIFMALSYAGEGHGL